MDEVGATVGQDPLEEHIQSLANILSLVAIISGMEKAAINRVLLSLGTDMVGVQTRMIIDQNMARKLLLQIASEEDEQTALHVASDMAFVAKAWSPVLEEYMSSDPYRLLPFAEIIFSLTNYSGVTLQNYGAFDRFGGPDVVLPMPQLSAALSPYPVPQVGLTWELVGFHDPPDQALVASDRKNIYLFKAASSGIDLRFSELERNTEDDARREHDVRIDRTLFAAFVAGLLGDMLYWAARLRAHALPGHETWQRLQALLTASGEQTTQPDQPDKPHTTG